MCGIVGAWALRPAAGPPPVAASLLDSLRHRGPDGGAWRADDRFRLGFRRLAIIDVDGGMQPLGNEDGRIVAAINGEVYNHQRLRAQLMTEHRFSSRSDAEVVVHGYEEWGVRVFSQLRGMFAVAIADRVADRLVLARDRAGKKPMYYRVDGDVLRFASEIHAVLPPTRRTVDPHALNDYLRFGYVPAPRTLFQGVYKLPAGCALVADRDGRIETTRWAPALTRAGRHRGSVEEWARLVRQILDEAVQLRLESEVPLGFLLSGGIDSASVFALGAQRLAPARAQAFTLGFADQAIDERAAAQLVAQRYGARHVVRRLEQSEAHALAGVVVRCGEPVATDALLPTDRIFAAVRGAGITTILSGEGADEIFAGYRKFGDAALASAGQPERWERAGTRPLARYLAHEEFCFADLEERRALVGEAATDAGFEELEGAIAELDPLSQSLSIEVALRLPDRINHRLDRLSMAHSVEARAPFMDETVMELALQAPHALRVRDGVPKWLLRHAMERDLPPEIVHGRKSPFRAPDTWFVGGGGGEDVRDAEEAGLVDPGVVGALRARADAGDIGATERLYSLKVLHLWHRHVFWDAPVPGSPGME